MPSCVLNVHQLELRLLAQLLVERGERFVEQQYFRLLDQRPRKRHALALATRELVRLALAKIAELHKLEHVIDSFCDLANLSRVLAQPVCDVLLDIHVREDRVRLKHHVDRTLVRRQRRDVDAVDFDRAAGRRFETRHHSQQGRLTTTGAPEYGEQFTLANIRSTSSTATKSPKCLLTPLMRMKSKFSRSRQCPLARYQMPLFARANARVRGRSRFGSTVFIG